MIRYDKIQDISTEKNSISINHKQNPYKKN